MLQTLDVAVDVGIAVIVVTSTIPDDVVTNYILLRVVAAVATLVAFVDDFSY